MAWSAALVQLVLVVAKIAGLVSWPWSAVFLPTWIQLASISILIAWVVLVSKRG